MQPGHTGTTLGSSAVEHSSRLKYIRPEQASMDSNSVDLNRERASFADNSLRYEATLRFINGRVRSMITAIRGE
jgi:flagellar basal-body rod protein FlgB